ncbi:TonB-dependent receptor [Shewanella denitrificans OS217]|uniref:TonB-dependent receptor n=1 Tax=Shewanella denitrificans (strain OS217 / ATCC BAA-1090 / DSM 15013) TaxID=318161 RepID=Q12JH5_SHEDO|nr:TonB-dependent receptor [Shewanella denitrificans]ABE56401.1 TonB-dependent receptor [Shewanella denitrificans OS217]
MRMPLYSSAYSAKASTNKVNFTSPKLIGSKLIMPGSVRVRLAKALRTGSLLGLASLIFTPLLSFSIAAEEQVSSQDTAKVQLKSPNEQDKNHSTLEVIQVIGTRLNLRQKALEVPRSMTVVTDKYIQDTQATELTDVLVQTPSISVSDNDRPLMGNISIRGFGNERINLEVDGVSYKQFSDGSNANGYISPLDLDPSIVRGVEITRGADGIGSGSGAIGGQVKVVTKGAWDYTSGAAGSGVLVRTGMDDATHMRRGGVTGYVATDELALVLHANRRTFGDIKLNPRDSEGSLRGQTQTLKNDGQSDDLRLKVNWDSAHGQLDSDTFYTASEVAELPFGNNTRWIDQALTESETGERLSQSLAYHYASDSQWLDLRAKAYYQDYQRVREQDGKIVLGKNEYPFNKQDSFEDQSFGLSLSNSINHQMNDWKGELQLFASVDRSQFEDTVTDRLTNTQATYYGHSQGDMFALGVRHESDYSSWLSTEAGIRLDSFSNQSDNFTEYGENSDEQWSSNLGVTIRPTEWLRFYGRYNESFRGANLRELYKKDEWVCHRPSKHCYSEPQPGLKPESSSNYEFGFGLVFKDIAFSDQLLFKLNWFDTQVDNYIDTAPYMYKLVDGQKVAASPKEATHRDYSSKNIGKLYSKGIEAELTYQYQDLDIFANYSRVRMDVEGMPNFYLGTIEQVRQPYTRAPQDRINLGLSWQLVSELRLSWVSSFAMDMKRLPELYLENEMDAEGYQVHSLYITYQASWLSGFELRAGVENLLDEAYSVWPDDEDTSLPGRNAKLALSYHF